MITITVAGPAAHRHKIAVGIARDLAFAREVVSHYATPMPPGSIHPPEGTTVLVREEDAPSPASEDPTQITIPYARSSAADSRYRPPRDPALDLAPKPKGSA